MSDEKDEGKCSECNHPTHQANQCKQCNCGESEVVHPTLRRTGIERSVLGHKYSGLAYVVPSRRKRYRD